MSLLTGFLMVVFLSLSRPISDFGEESYFYQNRYLAPKGSQVSYALPREEVALDENGRPRALGADLTPLTAALQLVSSTDPRMRSDIISLLRSGIEWIKKIKVIALDLAGVVCRNGMVLAMQRLSKRLSTDDLRVSYDDLKDIFTGNDFFLWTKNEISENEFWQRANTLFKHKYGTDLFALAPREEIRDIWFDAYEIFPGMEQLIRELRRKGYRVILFTNNTKEKFDHTRRRYDFDELFNGILNSADMGLSKKDHQIYDEMQRWTGVSPEEILYVDDVEEFLLYARAKGIRTLWYSNLSETPLSEKAVVAELLHSKISRILDGITVEQTDTQIAL
ncbi:MAG: HAD-IA family hydrolase [Candidatus Omnitrophica bacterium]|nr:HAD-IA family hydrolase [Candidatus Omnitrophota bacterium]